MVVGVGQVQAAAKDAVEGAWGMRVFRWGILIPNSALTMLSVSTPRSPQPARAWGKRSAGSGKSGRRDGLPLAFKREVTAVSRNSGTRRTREDSRGHDELDDWVQEDTQGTAGIRKDTPLCRFGTVRP